MGNPRSNLRYFQKEGKELLTAWTWGRNAPSEHGHIPVRGVCQLQVRKF